MKRVIYRLRSINLGLLLLIATACMAQSVKPTTDMVGQRIYHQIEVLPNGKVMVFGGQKASPPLYQAVVLNTCEVFDPLTETWAPAADMNFKRTKFISVVTQAGKVLAIGGESDSAVNLTTVESYDPATDTWTMVGNLSRSRKNGDAVLLDNGNILLVSNYQSSFEEATSSGAGLWTEHLMPNFAVIPESPRLIRMGNTKILAVGAETGPALHHPIIFTQSLTVDTAFAATEDHPQPGLALLPDGKVLIANGTATNTCELYNPVTNEITVTGNTHFARYGCTLMPMTNGKIASFNVGNTFNPNGDTEILEIYDPLIGQWAIINGHFFTGTQYHEVAPMGNGKYLITGGVEHLQLIGVGSPKCYIFDENGTTGIISAKNNFAAVSYRSNTKLLEVNLKNQGSANFAFYNIAGQVLYTKEIFTNNWIFSAFGYQSGVYLAVVTNTQTGNNIVQKIVVQ